MSKHTPKAVRAAEKVSDRYNAWTLDDLQNRYHTFRPERLEIIAAIIDEETSAESSVERSLMEVLNFVNGMVGMAPFEKEKLKDIIKLALDKSRKLNPA